eukprot:scaffold332939_cov55-Prasinocladus_malaysianus.AAC.1
MHDSPFLGHQFQQLRHQPGWGLAQAVDELRRERVGAYDPPGDQPAEPEGQAERQRRQLCL